MGFLTGVANDAGLPLDRQHPIRDFELPEALGHGRLHIKIPPVVAAPLFNLRKRPKVLYLLPQLVELGSLTPGGRGLSDRKARAHLGILIAGPTNSGKTSFLNALLHRAVSLDPKARYVVLEDVPEIVCPAEDTQQSQDLRARHALGSRPRHHALFAGPHRRRRDPGRRGLPVFRRRRLGPPRHSRHSPCLDTQGGAPAAQPLGAAGRSRHPRSVRAHRRRGRHRRLPHRRLRRPAGLGRRRGRRLVARVVDFNSHTCRPSSSARLSDRTF